MNKKATSLSTLLPATKGQAKPSSSSTAPLPAPALNEAEVKKIVQTNVKIPNDTYTMLVTGAAMARAKKIDGFRSQSDIITVALAEFFERHPELRS